jgi:putative hemolysin
MVVQALIIFALAALVALSAFASYLRLLMRRLTPVASRKVFPDRNGGHVGRERERIGISISALHGALMACFVAGLGALVLTGYPNHPWEALGTTLLIVLGVIAVFDQLIPFILVARHDEPEKILLEWCPLLRRLIYLALPLTFPILISTTISRLLEAGEPENEPPTPQEDLQELLEVGQQEGLIEKEEGEMLQSVVEFGDKPVREIMTPRPEIAALEIEASVEDLRTLFRDKRHLRFPVYRGTLDRIEGVASILDLMELSPEAQARATLQSLIRPATLVPETKRSGALLREMQRSTSQLAIVIDEYGSVTGLITLEDLVEEIVGEIRDEVEPHERDIVRESAHSFVVAGHTELGRIGDAVGQPIEAEDYSTVAGLVLSHLGHVPLPGEKVEGQGLSFEVLEANPRTVLKVRVRVTDGQPSQPARESSRSHASGDARA